MYVQYFQKIPETGSSGKERKKGLEFQCEDDLFLKNTLGNCSDFCHVFATFPIKNTVEKYLLKWKDAHDTVSQKKQATKKNVEDFPTFFYFVCTEKKMRQTYEKTFV